jgi:hypothetical protein
MKSHETLAMWGAIIVSVLVMAGFGAALALLFLAKLPTEGRDMALLLYGGINSMASAIVGYWVGSSMGSSRKDQTISDLAKTKP